ncbi:MAG: hypothetical protein DMD90_15365 [Candidatus Rokuibacteriota bacterium]|nr:MAG: hypothetical protein DMD90_15365 [Candidatus Rokubacteria bacterium]
MSDSEADQGFRVRDRRGRADEPASSPRPVTPPEPMTPPEPVSPPQPVSPPESTAGGARSLVGLFIMLGSVAAAALEGMPDSGGGQAKRDLRQAAELIDVLVLLREKTEGRRTPEETKVLHEVVYGLQLRYVEATRRPG